MGGTGAADGPPMPKRRRGHPPDSKNKTKNGGSTNILLQPNQRAGRVDSNNKPRDPASRPIINKAGVKARTAKIKGGAATISSAANVQENEEQRVLEKEKHPFEYVWDASRGRHIEVYTGAEALETRVLNEEGRTQDDLDSDNLNVHEDVATNMDPEHLNAREGVAISMESSFASEMFRTFETREQAWNT